MSRRCRIAHFLARIVNVQRIRSRQQRHRRISLVLVRIPNHLPRLVNTHVVGDGVRSIVHTARRSDVDGRRRNGQRGVVPDEGYFIADLVV